MLSDQMAAVLALLGGDGGERAGGLVPAAAGAAALALGVDGICAGVGTGPQGVVLAWGGHEKSAALDDAQFTLGEGPSWQALASGSPVLVPDLSTVSSRWPAFIPAALGFGVGAVFAFPLQIGAISVGVLLAYRAAAGPLSIEQLADALALADAVTVLLLHCEPSSQDPGQGAWKPPRPGWEQPATHRAEVHQATGVLSVQLSVPLAEALVRLRAHAYATGRPISEVAADVVAHRLYLEDSTL
ncbi:MAG TPA: GAF and ANTAR domain-containing protein [Actinocrinis sp.]|nr:GAF and ANTAR domain-containing protein [Actinocrinis sp.]